MRLIRKNPLLVFCFLIVAFASCKKAKVTPTPGKNLVLTSFEQQKVTADNAFTLSLFKNLDSANTTGGNLFVSPLSVSFALGMTSNGAGGSTLEAFKKTLNFAGLTQEQINNYYNNLITNLPQLDPNTTLSIANSIWYRQDFAVQHQFLQTDSSFFHAQVQALDFNSPSAINTINNWVSAKTKGKIPTIVNDIPSDMVMYLINAMYFKSSWNEKFDPAQTRPGNFYLADHSTVQANFMTGMVDMNSYYDDHVVICELPYANSKYSMVIVMPAGTDGSVNNLAAGLDSAQWQTWMSKLRADKNTINLPKFKFTYQAELKSALTCLGLGVAFSDTANFLGINPDPSFHLKISKVTHKTFVETDESGTTAAAVTSVGITATTAPAPLPPINHPFIFAIREMSSGLILFIGTVNNPLLQGI